MGLLDYINGLKFNPTPVNMGLLQMGAQMLANSGPSTTPQGFGTALGGGLLGFSQGYGDIMKRQREDEQFNMDKELKAAQIEGSFADNQYKLAQIDALKTGKLNAPTPGQWYIPPGSKPGNFGGLNGFFAPDGGFIASRAAMTDYQAESLDPQAIRKRTLAKESGLGQDFTFPSGEKTRLPQGTINPGAFDYGQSGMMAAPQKMGDEQAFYELYQRLGSDPERLLSEWRKLKGEKPYTTPPVGPDQLSGPGASQRLPVIGLPLRGQTDADRAAAEAEKAARVEQAKTDVELKNAKAIADAAAMKTGAEKSAQILAETTAKTTAELPKIIQNADYTISLLSKLESHPGLSGVVGVPNFYGAVHLPGTQETDFRVLLSQVLGRQFMEAYETLKGGGQITEIEGKKATDAMARLNTTQTEKGFKESITELKGILQNAKQRAISKAGGKYTQSPLSEQNNGGKFSGWTLE